MGIVVEGKTEVPPVLFRVDCLFHRSQKEVVDKSLLGPPLRFFQQLLEEVWACLPPLELIPEVMYECQKIFYLLTIWFVVDSVEKGNLLHPKGNSPVRGKHEILNELVSPVLLRSYDVFNPPVDIDNHLRFREIKVDTSLLAPPRLKLGSEFVHEEEIGNTSSVP